MRANPFVVGVAILILAASPSAAGPNPQGDAQDAGRSSGLQMGLFWAGARTSAGDLATFVCAAETLPHVKKGVSFRAELAAIGRSGLRPGRPIEVEARVDGGEPAKLSLKTDGGPAASLGEGEAGRRGVARLIAEIARGKELTLGFGPETASFGLAGAGAAMSDVAACARDG